MSTNITQIRDDLWQTRTDSAFPGLTTHAYLWRGPSGNVLFYSPASDADFEAIEELGGVTAQYLSHLDEAGPMLARVAARFGSRLHALPRNWTRSGATRTSMCRWRLVVTSMRTAST
jgi:hypothetical protein